MFRVLVFAMVLSLLVSPPASAYQIINEHTKEGERLMRKGERLRTTGIVFTSMGLANTLAILMIGSLHIAAYEERFGEDDVDTSAMRNNVILSSVAGNFHWYAIGAPCWGVGNKKIRQGRQMIISGKKSYYIPAPSIGYVAGSENPFRVSLTWNW